MKHVQIATETERKYDVPDDFQLPGLPGAGDPEVHELDATYYDTDDLRLARHRRTLRRRSGGTDAGWHLKTPGEGSSRTEHRLPLDGDDVPDELRSEVRAIMRDAPLRPVARLRTCRTETPLRDDAGRTLALIAQDRVTAETDGDEQRWQELEVELVDGDETALERVEQALLAAGATPAAGPSKLARALGDRLPAPSGATGKVHPVLVYAREQRDAIAAYDPGVRRGEPESVHKMRVATRRLRSTLKTFKRSFPPTEVGQELKWLAHQLGEVRDGQVLEHKLLASVENAGPDFAPVAEAVRAHLDAKVRNGHEALARDLDSTRYFRLLDEVDELVAGSTGERRPVRRAGKVLDKADRLLDEATITLRDEPLHEARKAYKQARYAIEVVGDKGGKAAEVLVTKMTDLQDVLGGHQDSVVAREILEELAAGSDHAFRYGILYARQEEVARDTMGEIPGAVAAIRKPKLRSWLT
jgi:CHAD domain-containing protein